MSCTPPSAKQAKLSAPINNLADSDLEEIFKRLPPYERLIVSEVCSRWHAISRKAWLDICKIDLTPIPGKHIGAIVNQCPNLQSVFAAGKSFDANDLACLAKIPSLKRVSLFGCGFKLNPDKAGHIEQSIFLGSLENASWTELILHGAHFIAPRIPADACAAQLGNGTAFLFNVANLPASLTHLQLSSLLLCQESYSESSLSLDGLARLENLECFILDGWSASHHLPVGYKYTHDLVANAVVKRQIFDQIVRLKNLNELFVGPAMWLNEELTRAQLILALPKLDVLFLTHVHRTGDNLKANLAELMTSNSVLRILVLSGLCYVGESIDLPARKRFPHGFGSDPLPLLHVFIGKAASEKIRFTKSTSDAAIIHPINQPMPEFLQREDIAPIFDGVWVAEKIKEMAKHGGKLWNYDIHDTAFSIQRA